MAGVPEKAPVSRVVTAKEALKPDLVGTVNGERKANG
jgi:hypothetical protein